MKSLESQHVLVGWACVLPFFFFIANGSYLSSNTLGFRLAPSSQRALKHVSLFSISFFFFFSVASILAPFVAEEALWQLRLKRIAMGGVGLTQL